MRKNKFLLFTVYCLLSTVFLWGCGGGAGSPGSSGSEDTGILIGAASITKEEGPDLDVFTRSLACPPDKPTKPETLRHREDAVMHINATKLNPGSTFDPFPAKIEQCTITYKKANEDPSVPVLESLAIQPSCNIYDAEDNTCPVTLIDIDRKDQYWSASNNGTNLPAEYPTHYIAQYKCKYKNNYGESGYIQTQYDLWLADFLVCD
jgi:hypothetical protein